MGNKDQSTSILISRRGKKKTKSRGVVRKGKGRAGRQGRNRLKNPTNRTVQKSGGIGPFGYERKRRFRAKGANDRNSGVERKRQQRLMERQPTLAQ